MRREQYGEEWIGGRTADAWTDGRGLGNLHLGDREGPRPSFILRRTKLIRSDDVLSRSWSIPPKMRIMSHDSCEKSRFIYDKKNQFLKNRILIRDSWESDLAEP